MDKRRSRVECALITFHGTVLTSGKGAPLGQSAIEGGSVPSGTCRVFISSELPTRYAHVQPLSGPTLEYESDDLGEGIAEVVGNSHGYGFKLNGLFLSASAYHDTVGWDRETAQTWESFLPISIEVLEVVCRLQRQDWRLLRTGERVSGGAIRIRQGFNLKIGQYLIPLYSSYPIISQSGARNASDNAAELFFIPHHSSTLVFAAIFNNERETPRRFWLRNSESEADHGSGTALKADEIASLAAVASEEFVVPPTFASRQDRSFFFEKAWNRRPAIGLLTNNSWLEEANDCFMFLSRTLEGVVFNATGVQRTYGYLASSKELPTGLSKSDGRVMIDAHVMDDAPLIEGEFAVFYNGNLQNYYHWLIDAILPLWAIQVFRPHSYKIVLPSRLADVSSVQYVESLKLLGFGAIEIVFSDAPLVRLETALWLKSRTDLFESYPAPMLRDFQTKVTDLLDIKTAKVRILVQRKRVREIENIDQVANFLVPFGFVIVLLEDLPLLEQISFFARADFVIAPHGAGLSNLIFAPPECRVIEFMPNVEMRPFFWRLSSKLGHEYGMIPCETDTGTFNGRVRVDLGKLSRTFQLLEQA